MKQIYLTIIALVLFLIIGAGSASAGSFAIGEAPGLVTGNDQTIKVPVNVTGANNLEAYTLQFTINAGSAGGATAALSSKAPNAGLVNGNKIVATLTKGLSGEQTIAYIDVTPGTIAGTITISVTPVTMVESGSKVQTYSDPGDLKITITAGPAKISEITVDETDPAQYKISSSLQLSADILDGNNAKIPGINPAWTSSDPAVITVDQNGNCRLLALGTATITASLPGHDNVAPKTKQITVLDAYTEISNTIAAGAQHSGWNSNTGASATYLAAITGTAYDIPVPQYTRDGLTAPILQTGDTDTAVKVTWQGDKGGSGTLVVSGGKITVPATGSSGSTEYTITFTGRKLGDVDGDGTVDSADALKITKHYAGIPGSALTDYQLFYADVNGKNKVTAADALAILELTVDFRDKIYEPTEAYWKN